MRSRDVAIRRHHRHRSRVADSAPQRSAPMHCAGAGFADCTTHLVRATWRHTDARAMVSALQAGTARMAAMIEAQTAAAMPAIVADIEEHAARYRDTDGIAVPIAAVIAAGVKR